MTPSTISAASLLDIAEAIHPADMYNQRRIISKEVAEKILTLYDGNLTQVLSEPYPEAHEELMKLPCIGKKTADVVLLFNAGKLVLPVDRYIARIPKRLGIIPSNADYDTIRMNLECRTATKNYLDAHIKLIYFGRDVCRAHNPKCFACPISDLWSHHIETRRNHKSPNETQSSPKRLKRA